MILFFKLLSILLFFLSCDNQQYYTKKPSNDTFVDSDSLFEEIDHKLREIKEKSFRETDDGDSVLSCGYTYSVISGASIRRKRYKGLQTGHIYLVKIKDQLFEVALVDFDDTGGNIKIEYVTGKTGDDWIKRINMKVMQEL